MVEPIQLYFFNNCQLASYLKQYMYKTYIMTQQNDEKKKKADEKEKEPAIKADPETTHTTDPQEKMKGPISSLVQGVKEVVEENDKESKEEATKKRDEHM